MSKESELKVSIRVRELRVAVLRGELEADMAAAYPRPPKLRPCAELIRLMDELEDLYLQQIEVQQS